MKTLLGDWGASILAMTVMMTSACGGMDYVEDRRAGTQKSIRLTHPTEPSIEMRIPIEYFANDSFIDMRTDDARVERKTVTVNFGYPLDRASTRELREVPVGDCIQKSSVCRFYAALSVAKPGAIVTFFEGSYDDNSPGSAPLIDGLQSYSGESENLLSYFHAPSEQFPSGVLISCIRASAKNIAGCRIFFQTPRRLSVVLGGLSDKLLPDWRNILLHVTERVDSFVLETDGQ